MQSKLFSTNKTLRLAGRLLDLSTPRVMGIINVTPDSFYAGSRQGDEASLLKQAERMLHDGAEVLDVGGYSTRPNAHEVSVDDEIARVAPAIEAIRKNFPTAIVSIDTFRSQVAQTGIDAGAMMVNDVSGGELDHAMLGLVATRQVPYILMHMRGNPQTMTSLNQYDHLVRDVVRELQLKIAALTEKGVTDLVVDPGFGFAKSVQQNFDLLKGLDYLKVLGKPILVGLSRKSMIWRTLQTDAEKALNGTTALHSLALLKGVSILRVHDVKEAVEVVKLIKFVQ